ncbi:hypothetical protein LP414_08205 [Polaromonas sp. P1(28)-13]|nr:hypothetical protein LP414_08205 [Polaromonas sp. P1(28)-13]
MTAELAVSAHGRDRTSGTAPGQLLGNGQQPRKASEIVARIGSVDQVVGHDAGVFCRHPLAHQVAGGQVFGIFEAEFHDVRDRRSVRSSQLLGVR